MDQHRDGCDGRDGWDAWEGQAGWDVQDGTVGMAGTEDGGDVWDGLARSVRYPWSRQSRSLLQAGQQVNQRIFWILADEKTFVDMARSNALFQRPNLMNYARTSRSGPKR